MKLPKGTRLAIWQALEKTHPAPERKRILARTQRLYNAFIREHTEAEGFSDCDFWYLMENDAER